MRTKTVNISQGAHKALKQLALDRDTTIQALIDQAVPVLQWTPKTGTPSEPSAAEAIAALQHFGNEGNAAAVLALLPTVDAALARDREGAPKTATETMMLLRNEALGWKDGTQQPVSMLDKLRTEGRDDA